ncbi:calcyphosin-like protein [Tubulanus polymorphus]|uniref:calcyphosin-like protein n=1 Tax=Tubulanus polymorphus TaxID=672921 RepID=UPI003DA3AF60
MAPIDVLRFECLERGVNGIKALGALFRGLDRDFSLVLTWDEFYAGLKKFGVRMDDSDMRSLFIMLDKDNSGSIDFAEFLEKLRPKMTPNRISVINEVFDKLDTSGDGLLQTDDLKGVFTGQVYSHPKYRSGEWSEEQVLVSFLKTFDTPNDPDGVVTREEFMNYYAGVSSTIDDDVYFDLMMRQCWGLPQKRT